MNFIEAVNSGKRFRRVNGESGHWLSSKDIENRNVNFDITLKVFVNCKFELEVTDKDIIEKLEKTVSMLKGVLSDHMGRDKVDALVEKLND